MLDKISDAIEDIKKRRFSWTAGPHQPDKFTTLFGDVDVLNSCSTGFEMVEYMIRSKCDPGLALANEEFTNDVAVVDRSNLIPAYGTPRRENVGFTTSEDNAVKV